MKKSAKPEIIHGYPPNINEIEAVLKPNENTIFAYHPNIYVPSGKKLQPHGVLHEELHLSQQREMGPEKWWNKYLTDREFRLSQELPAFGVQYAFLRTYLSPKELSRALTDFALTLSGEQYDLGIPYHKAERMIKDKAKEYGN